MKVFNKILIANRGEIAVRIIRTLKKLGISSVAVYSQKDAGALHAGLADEAYMLSGETLLETYLDIGKIIEIAKESGAEAIHPGYGFLSENPAFSGRVSREGINFIGPPADVIRHMGNKLEARALARKAGLPLIEGYEGKASDLLKNAGELDYPVIVKAAAGGGGKAMRIVRSMDEFPEALEITSREAKNYFGDDGLYVEKYVEQGRHIEVQVLADHYGNIIIPGERECSIQRCYQKVIEETPSIFLKPAKREELFRVSERIVREIGYVNAGTLEFLVDEKQNFYFLEMNTRIQVEHPVTEAVTGLDIVEQQIYIAAGNSLKIKQGDIVRSGHAIQARIYAEDPSRNFLPSPGRILSYKEPSYPGLRIDAGMDSPGVISPDFDPMVAKVIAHAPSREEAILLLSKALENYHVTGLTTNREFVINILGNSDYRSNEISITWLENARGNLMNELSNRRNAIDPIRIFSAWLLFAVFGHRKTGNNVWHRVGYWRHHIRKSFFYNGRQIDMEVVSKKEDKLVFAIDGAEHNAQLRSLQDNKINFMLDGIWNSATVTLGKDIEDIVFINGYEYRIRPVDYLPDVPFLREDIAINGGGLKILRSPLHGRVVKLNAEINSKVSRGQILFTLDAMKIENRITSPWEGCVKEIRIREGDQVKIDQDILIIDVCTENN